MLVHFCKAVGQALDPQESGWIAGCGLTSLAQLVVFFFGNLGESNIIFFDSSWVKKHTFNGLGWENQPDMDFPMKYLGNFLNSPTSKEIGDHIGWHHSPQKPSAPAPNLAADSLLG